MISTFFWQTQFRFLEGQKNFTTHNPAVPNYKTWVCDCSGSNYMKSVSRPEIHHLRVWCESFLPFFITDGKEVTISLNSLLALFSLFTLNHKAYKQSSQKVFRTFYMLLWCYTALITRWSRSVSGTILNHLSFFPWTDMLLCCVLAFYMCGLVSFTFRTGSLHHLCVLLFIASLSWLLCRDPPLFNHFYFPLSH